MFAVHLMVFSQAAEFPKFKDPLFISFIAEIIGKTTRQGPDQFIWSETTSTPEG
jgi:hypothetical protein